MSAFNFNVLAERYLQTTKQKIHNYRKAKLEKNPL